MLNLKTILIAAFSNSSAEVDSVNNTKRLFVERVLNSFVEPHQKARAATEALVKAVANKYIWAIPVLCAAGADLQNKIYRGLTPLHTAIDNWRCVVSKQAAEIRLEVIRVLIKAGADIESVANFGICSRNVTPLTLAAGAKKILPKRACLIGEILLQQHLLPQEDMVREVLLWSGIPGEHIPYGSGNNRPALSLKRKRKKASVHVGVTAKRKK